jgi:hypothetical protein
MMRHGDKLVRDYVDIIAKLRQEGTPCALEGADALEELNELARRMTVLGVDLEREIQEDLTPDYYAVLKEGSQIAFLVDPQTIGETMIPNQPVELTALKVIGESWFVRFGGDKEPSEFYSREALDEAVAQHEKETE